MTPYPGSNTPGATLRSVRTSLIAFLAVFAFGVVACSGADADSPPRVPSAERRVLKVEGNGESAKVTVELATKPDQRQQGLMFRQEMDEDAGMLFIFPEDNATGFWMKNTYIPLDIAYISAEGRVLEIKAAKPLDETLLAPAGPYRYTLEVNAGWFLRHNLGPGATIHLPPDLPRGE